MILRARAYLQLGETPCLGCLEIRLCAHILDVATVQLILQQNTLDQGSYLYF